MPCSCSTENARRALMGSRLLSSTGRRLRARSVACFVEILAGIRLAAARQSSQLGATADSAGMVLNPCSDG
eukprot:CAMPEP_0181230692 /NCGR_PEP_ID=MMETSP1096-20121128/34632_1 /TAXON_ID=156174 ORGANISM="Chrysochromulina ericina, Strain CCMP281" /NCGR_SAMPLE_ID=MMETSP1096 /ASSEMBLY_ACC=CAM_ASM_000453 /LENGTH=70 /DNA_ID=CAMNT_0023324531 /DNA_START=58 /DNA_END=270 /DNA_ORIENTATION=+